LLKSHAIVGVWSLGRLPNIVGCSLGLNVPVVKARRTVYLGLNGRVGVLSPVV